MATAILYPVLAQIILTLIILGLMAYNRTSALASGEVRAQDIAIDNTRWPERIRKYANCYGNQFELPVVFYVLCLISHTTRTADLIFVILAWIFVITRIVHAFIHTGSNVVRLRGGVFGLGFIVIVIMTLYMTFRLLLPPSV
jgi:hypothetical protein